MGRGRYGERGGEGGRLKGETEYSFREGRCNNEKQLVVYSGTLGVTFEHN